MTSANGRPDILLVSGKYFDYLNPESNEFTIADIAHHLSQLCRFAGATQTFYSVAQHSVLVSELCPEKYALIGLLHDMAEMAMVDIPAPLKKLLPDYQRIEKHVEAAMCARMQIGYPFPPEVKEADILARWIEQRDLMPLHDDHWAAFSDLDLKRVERAPTISPLRPFAAEAEFRRRYDELVAGMPPLPF